MCGWLCRCCDFGLSQRSGFNGIEYVHLSSDDRRPTHISRLPRIEHAGGQLKWEDNLHPHPTFSLPHWSGTKGTSGHSYIIGRLPSATRPLPIDTWVCRLSLLTKMTAERWAVCRKMMAKTVVLLTTTVGAQPLIFSTGTSSTAVRATDVTIMSQWS